MAGFEETLTKEEQEAFYSQDSERAKAIVLGTIVENHITELLRLSLRRNTAIWNELFQPSGALGNFGTKVRMAYMGGLIGESLYKDLVVVNRVRNEFAHKLSVQSFESQPIRDWIKNMHVYSILVAMKDEKDKKPTGSESEANFQRAMKLLLDNTFLSVRDIYRECLRLIIHQITDLEGKMRQATAHLDMPPTSPGKS